MPAQEEKEEKIGFVRVTTEDGEVKILNWPGVMSRLGIGGDSPPDAMEKLQRCYDAQVLILKGNKENGQLLLGSLNNGFYNEYGLVVGQITTLVRGERLRLTAGQRRSRH